MRNLPAGKTITKIQAIIIAVIVVVAAVGAFAFYHLILPPAPPPPKPPIGIFMMKVTSHDDWGWGTSSFHALKYVAEKYNLTWAFKELIPFGALETVFLEACASPEYHIIFWSGIEAAEFICRHAHKFPDKLLISTCLPSADLPYAPPNWATLFFLTADVGYLAGYLAALMTKTKMIGVVTGTELMCGNMYTNGFKQGAYAADPEVRVIYAESGVWGDPVKDKETALALADMGVDVIFNLWCTVGVAEACKERGIYQIGVYNMREYAPDVTIADAIEDHAAGLDMIVGDWLKGKPTWKAYRVPARIEINEKIVPKHIIEKIYEIHDKIMGGEIVPLYVLNRTPDPWPLEPVPIEKLILMDFEGAAYLPKKLRDWLIEKYGYWK